MVEYGKVKKRYAYKEEHDPNVYEIYVQYSDEKNYDDDDGWIFYLCIIKSVPVLYTSLFMLFSLTISSRPTDEAKIWETSLLTVSVSQLEEREIVWL